MEKSESPQLPECHQARPAGLCSPTVISMQSAGWWLVLCMWLPVNRGCGGTVNRPIEQLEITTPFSFVDLLGDLWILGSYGNGLLAASLLAASAIWCSERLWWRSTLVQFAVAIFLSASALVLLFINNPELKEIVRNSLVFVVPWVLSLGWIIRALWRGERQAAWARLQHSWTLVGAFVLQIQCIFSVELLYGYWFSLIGFVALLFVVELARYRMAHDLWDRTRPPLKPRISIRKIFAWTTFSAIVLVYFPLIDTLIGWLFPESDQ